MKKEYFNHRTIFHKLIKDLDEDNIGNTKLIYDENFASKKNIIQNRVLDAKIKHRKKREGD